MPATILAHQAVVLPLKLWRPRRISGLALCIGSAAPDLEFIFRMTDDWVFSHTLAAQFYFTVPVSLLLLWLTTALMIPAFLPYLPPVQRRALAGMVSMKPPRTPDEWRVAAMCALIGGVSHYVVDGFTHANHSGWAVALLPVLHSTVPLPVGHAPLYDVLQVGLTLVLPFAAVRWLDLLRRRAIERQTPAIVPGRSRAEAIVVTLVIAAAALAGAFAGGVLRAEGAAITRLAGVTFGALNGAFVAAVLLAIALVRRSETRVDDVSPSRRGGACG